MCLKARVGAFTTQNVSFPLSAVGKTADFQWLCAGSVLSDRVVLTAAHCVTPAMAEKRVVMVRLGEVNTLRGSGCEEDRYATFTTLHPDYSPASGSYFNDLALLLIDKPVLLHGHISSIDLPPRGLLLNNGVTVILGGWGQTEYDAPESVATVLKRAVRKVEPIERCRDALPPNAFDKHFPGGLKRPEVICVSAGKHQPICQGDSGGPVALPLPISCHKGDATDHRQCPQHMLVGIINSGVACGNKDFPSINLTILPHITWIRSTMEAMKQIYIFVQQKLKE